MGRSGLSSRLLMVVPAVFVPSASAQPVVYVDAQAEGTGAGSSWCDAFTFLQDALAYAQVSAGAVSEIRVAHGLYKPDQGASVTQGDRTASFHLLSDVAIRGGYAGCDTEDPDERDIERFETVLSGDLIGDDEEVPIECTNHEECRAKYDRGLCDLAFGSGRCLVDLRDENADHVVDGSGTAKTALLEGFTIERGYVDDGHVPAGIGAALLIVDGDPMVRNCTFAENLAENGGAIGIAFGGRPTITGCDFTLNVGLRGGGAVFINYDSEVDVTDCTFRANSSANHSGGAVYLSGSSALFARCAFIGNSAPSGGAVRVDGSRGPSMQPVFLNCMYVANVGTLGAAIYNHFAAPHFLNCTFSNNFARSFGGGLFNSRGSAPVLVNCLIYGNSDETGSGESAQIADQSRGAIWSIETRIDYSLVQGWTGNLGGVGNIGLDPMFVDPVGADGIPGTMDDDLRLMPGSPAIDAGANAALPGSVMTDLAGLSRRVDDPATPDTGEGKPPIVDMGAYEYQARLLWVAMDVKPGNDLNPVNLGSRGVLPVAVLTTSVADGDTVDFDAANVNPESLTLAGAAPLANGRRGRIESFRDVDHDGDLDLVVQFAIEDLDLTPPNGDCPGRTRGRPCPPRSIDVVLFGSTFDGTPIRGVDTITTRFPRGARTDGVSGR